MASKRSVITYLKKVIKERGLSEKEFSNHFSNKRVNLIKCLNKQELEAFEKTMLLFTDKYLLDGVYVVMFDMKVIPSILNDNNDELIIDYLKTNNHINHYTNEMIVINHTIDKIKIVAPFSNLTYIEKYILVKFLGDIYLKIISN